MSAQRIRLYSIEAKQHACRQIMAADYGKIVTIAEPTRSLEQNAKLHAMLSDIARQAIYCGAKRTIDQWKVIFVSGHAVATGIGADVLPGLEGEFCNIRESTASMTVARKASLIEYVQAWGSSNGIRFSCAEWECE